MASPFKDELRKDQPFNIELNEKNLKAIRSVREKLILPLVFAIPYSMEQMVFDADACDF